MKRHLIILLTLFFATSCKNKTDSENLPSVEQSIEFITHKVDGKEISLTNEVFTNVEFKVINGRCNYKYEYISSRDNAHYEIVELFYLKDIDYVGFNSFGQNYYIKLELDKNSNHRYSKSLNGRPLSDYGFTSEEWLREAYVNVRKSDRESVEKAFRNIVKLQENNRADEYFENNE